jgi:hydrogenase maturation protease
MHGATLFIGVGSPHGDDRAGWLAADALSEIACARRSTTTTNTPTGRSDVAIHKVGSPVDLFDWLDDAANLIICDAVRGAGPAGTLHRWIWPDERFGHLRSTGSHDFGLNDVLKMAVKLGRLPSQVVVWGIEAGRVDPNGDVSPEIRQALPDLVDRIWSELGHA